MFLKNGVCVGGKATERRTSRLCCLHPHCQAKDLLSPVNMASFASPTVGTRFHHLSGLGASGESPGAGPTTGMRSSGALFSPRYGAPTGGGGISGGGASGLSRADIIRLESDLKSRLESATAKIEASLHQQEVQRVADRAALMERIDTHLVDVLRASAASGGGGAGGGGAAGGGGGDRDSGPASGRLEVVTARLQDLTKRLGTPGGGVCCVGRTLGRMPLPPPRPSSTHWCAGMR